VTEHHKSVIQVTLTFTIESTATLSRPGMPLKPARVARLVAFSSRPDRIGSMARRKCRDVRTVVIRFLRRSALRITVSESILGVSDFVTTPIPPEIPPRLIGYHWILVDVSGHAMR
jgi:hypothetical protein